jgi:hypothetical protein
MAPSHVDLSVLWVPIMPETSKLGEQMEQVGKDATESFGKGSSGLGDQIHESVTKSNDKIKDVFHRTGSDAGKSMSDAFKEETKAVETAAGDAGEKANHKFRDKAKDLGKLLVDAVDPDVKRQLGDRLEDAVGGALDGVLGDKSKIGGKFARTFADWGFDKLKDNLGQTKVGIAGVADSFGKLGTAAQAFGVDVGDLPEPIQDVVNKTNDIKTTAQGFADIFKDLPGKVGLVGTAISELAVPLAAVGAAVDKINDSFDKAGGQRKWDDVINPPDPGAGTSFWDKAGRLFQSWVPGGTFSNTPGKAPAQPPTPVPPDMLLGPGGGSDQASANFHPGGDPKRWGDTLGSGSDAYDFFSSGQPLGAAPSAATSTPAAPSSASLPSSFAGALPSPSSRADLHASGSKVANLYKVAQSLQGTPYSQQLRNDCSGMVSKLATAALGMEPSVQFSTVNEGDFLFSHGFKPGMGGPNDLNIGWYDHGGGNAGHTAATLPGGVNAESGGSVGSFALGGKVGANDPQFTQHAFLPMGGSGSINIPTGEQHNPLYVMAADKGSGASGAAGGDDSLAQQFGSGFLGGIAQSVGLDGSVFKTFGGASNPMDFGLAKLGTGLLNWGAGMMGHGPGISANASQPATLGPTGAPTYNVDQSFNLTQHGVQGNGEAPYRAAMNSSNRTAALAANLPG